MKSTQRKAHWENVFETKDTTRVSWYQSTPNTSLSLIEKLDLPANASILEVGSGDSFLGDCLLERGYANISLLDISEKALSTIKKRLGDQSGKVSFLAKDITTYSASEKYLLWHDRAVFHFLTDKEDIKKYLANAANSIAPNGYLVIGTFSDQGPKVCSDLQVQQYSEEQLSQTFSKDFTTLELFTENHNTPSGSVQNFVFGVFQKK